MLCDGLEGIGWCKAAGSLGTVTSGGRRAFGAISTRSRRRSMSEMGRLRMWIAGRCVGRRKNSWASGYRPQRCDERLLVSGYRPRHRYIRLQVTLSRTAMESSDLLTKRPRSITPSSSKAKKSPISPSLWIARFLLSLMTVLKCFIDCSTLALQLLAFPVY